MLFLLSETQLYQGFNRILDVSSFSLFSESSMLPHSYNKFIIIFLKFMV